MPKLLFGVSSSFCANFLRGQVAYFIGRGFEVVIISGPGEEISLLAHKEGARLYNVNFTKTIGPLHDLDCLIQIIRILKTEKPDIVHAGNPKSGFLIMLASTLSGIANRVFTLHGLVSDTRTGLKKLVIRWTEKMSCQMAEKVMVVSPSLLEHAVAEKILPAKKARVFGRGSCNGVDLNRFSRTREVMEKANETRKETGLKDGHFVIGFIGRLSGDKGIDLLFEAFNKLRLTYSDITLLIAGPIEHNDPFSKKYTEQLYQDEQVIYLGKVLDVVPLYPLMNTLVLTSYREGFGNVLIEAAAMEIPVIAPDIPGCRDALQDGVNGMLFQKGNVEDLILKIRRYLDDPVLADSHARAGRRFTEHYFQQEMIWSQQYELYRELPEKVL
jgi:glycosyltransferase involved in cell wall biosynthesis